MEKTSKNNSSSFTVSINLKLLCIILLLVIAGMLALWRPWEGNAATRSLTIAGEASISAEPDEFQFSPSFIAKGTDLEKLKSDTDAKANTVFKDIKALGVDESDIVINSSSNGYYNYENDDGEQTVSAYVQIKVKNKTLAQKVQDYLATSGAEGQLTSYPTFSKEKAKKLENEGREKAIANARSKAESTARTLKVQIGKVISFKDQTEQIYYPLDLSDSVSKDGASSARETLPVTPGRQEVTYRVQVIFELY